MIQDLPGQHHENCQEAIAKSNQIHRTSLSICRQRRPATGPPDSFPFFSSQQPFTRIYPRPWLLSLFRIYPHRHQNLRSPVGLPILPGGA